VQTTVPSPVITAAVLPRSKVVSIALVIGFALLTAGAAQLVIPLPYTPVPITGQTFVVLLAGVALGSNLGAASMALYVALGAIGLPFYAEGSSGIEVVRGATGGYLVGFVVAAWVMGRLAERRQDRALATAIPVVPARIGDDPPLRGAVAGAHAGGERHRGDRAGFGALHRRRPGQGGGRRHRAPRHVEAGGSAAESLKQ